MRILKKRDPESLYQKYKAARELGMADLLKETFIDELCDRIQYFGYSSNGVSQFPIYIHELGLPWMTFVDYLERYPKLKAAYIQTQKLLACRILEAALENKINANMARLQIFHYDKEYLNVMKQIAGKDNEDAAIQKVVVIEKIEPKEPNEERREDPVISKL